MAKVSKKRRAWGSNRVAAVEASNGHEPDPIVGGEPNPGASGPTIGTAIDSIRRALEPYDGATRKRLVRAAEMMLK